MLLFRLTEHCKPPGYRSARTVYSSEGRYSAKEYLGSPTSQKFIPYGSTTANTPTIGVKRWGVEGLDPAFGESEEKRREFNFWSVPGFAIMPEMQDDIVANEEQ